MLRKLNESLENGILPDELNFGINQNNNNQFDWDKVRYNTFGRNENWIMEHKIPKAIHNLPGIEKIVELVKESMTDLTPSEEIDRLKNESLIKISDNNIENE